MRRAARAKEKPRREAGAQVSQASKRSVLRDDRRLAPRIAAKAVVQAEPYDIDILVARAEAVAAVNACIEGSSEINKQVLDLGRPVGSECPFNPAADGPASRRPIET